MTAASAASVLEAPHSARTPVRDPLAAHLLTAAVAALLIALLARGAESLAETIAAHWPALLFWVVLVFIVNLFPVTVGDARLSLDMPLLLTVALLYGPETSGLLAFAAAIDLREVKREVGLSRAVFNRSQIALSIYLASLAFENVAGSLEPWWRAVAGTSVALSVDAVANYSFVALHAAVRRHQSVGSAARSLTVDGGLTFRSTYLGYGALALVLARLFMDVGAWAVVGFLIPTLVAREMLIRGQELQRVTEALRARERLLERLVDRVGDERRDERLRIAGDLHDDVLQALTGIWLLAKYVQQQKDPEVAATDLVQLVADTEGAIHSLRMVIHDLKESPVGRGGLIPALESLVRDLRLDWKMEIELATPKSVNLGQEEQLLVYQFVREALLNALKHSRASEIHLVIQDRGDLVTIAVEDNGIGFNAHATDRTAHFGIGLMEERVARAGGTLEIRTAHNAGTRLSASFPREPRPEKG